MSCCASEPANQGHDERRDQEYDGARPGLARQVSVKWRIRPMRHEDIDKCLEIWRQVELTEAHVTVASVLATDPRGFYVAELESSGEVIGMCAGAMTRADTAFMGFYAVEPAFQCIGVGRELWAKTVARLESAAHNIGLYGVPAMSAKYKKSGFKLEDSIRMLIHESRPGEQLAIGQLRQLHDMQELDRADEFSWRSEVISGRTSAMLIKKLIDYDERVNRHSREKLLRNYLTDGPQVPLTVALVRTPRQLGTTNASGSCQCPAAGHPGERKSSCCLQPSQEVIKEDEALSTCVKGSLSISAINNVGCELHLRSSSPIDIPSPVVTGAQNLLGSSHHHYHNHNYSHLEFMGYGCIRHDNTGGAMIGPIYARSVDVYEVVLRELVAKFNMRPGGKYSAMSLTSNEQTAKILANIGFEEMDQCSRMFTKFVPEASLDQIFLVHSPNFTLF